MIMIVSGSSPTELGKELGFDLTMEPKRVECELLGDNGVGR